MRRTRKVFLSYARPDEAEVAAVYDRLRSAGYEPWMDVCDIPGGRDWRESIRSAVRSADVVLAMVSPNSVDRPGILRGEMREALEVRQERLDGGGFLIPVRLEETELPEELARFQWVDWFRPDGWERLLAALPPPRHDAAGVKTAAVVATMILIAGLGWFGMRKWNGGDISSATQFGIFARSRPGSPTAPDSDAPPQIGLTIWRVKPEAGYGPCGESSRRASLQEPLKVSDQIRLSIQVSRPGYLYIISAEVSGTDVSRPILLFPISPVNNYVRPGRVADIPPRSDCRPLELKHAGTAEHLFVLLTGTAIPEFAPRDREYPIAPELFDRFRHNSAFTERSVRGEVSTGQPMSAQEADAADGKRELGYADPPPESLFTFRRGTPLPVMAQATLRVAQ